MNNDHEHMERMKNNAINAGVAVQQFKALVDDMRLIMEAMAFAGWYFEEVYTDEGSYWSYTHGRPIDTDHVHSTAPSLGSAVAHAIEDMQRRLTTKEQHQ